MKASKACKLTRRVHSGQKVLIDLICLPAMSIKVGELLTTSKHSSKSVSPKSEAYETEQNIVHDFESTVASNQCLEMFANFDDASNIFLQLLQPVHSEGEVQLQGAEASAEWYSEMSQIHHCILVLMLQVPLG